MTISSTENRKEYAGNGSTDSFPYPNKFFADTDIVVELLDTTTNVSAVQVLNTDYTMLGVGLDAGGSVEMVVPPATGENLIIFWDGAATQSTDYVENDSFPAESHENALDKLTRLVQRSRELVTRSVQLSDADTSGVDLTIPPTSNILNRALQFLQFDSAGNLTVGSVVSDIGAFVVSALNIASAIVQRDGSGNFAAGTITANLTGDTAGTHTGPVTGDVTGNTSGTHTGPVTGDVTGNADTATTAAGVVETGSGAGTLKVKVIEIGDWDMTASPTVLVNHGLDQTKIRSIDAFIRDDLGTRYPLSSGASTTNSIQQGFIDEVDGTQVVLKILGGGKYDTAAFNQTSYNRGWITIWYIV